MYAGAAQVEVPNPLKATTFAELIDGIVAFLWKLALALGPVMIVIAGFFFITAAGDPNKIQRAKDIILYTAIGILVIGISSGLMAMIKKLLTVK